MRRRQYKRENYMGKELYGEVTYGKKTIQRSNYMKKKLYGEETIWEKKYIGKELYGKGIIQREGTKWRENQKKDKKQRAYI